MLFSLVVWSAAYSVAGSIGGYGALLAAQLASAVLIAVVLQQAPLPGSLGPRHTWKRAGVAGILGGTVLAGVALALSGGPVGDGSVLTASSTRDILLGAAVIVIGAPLAEEMLFRQGMQRQLELTGSVSMSILLSSLLFAGAHPEAIRQPQGALLLVSAGIMLSVMRRKEGLPAAIFAHSAYNGSILAATVMAAV